jgi:hypothetical protein
MDATNDCDMPLRDPAGLRRRRRQWEWGRWRRLFHRQRGGIRLCRVQPQRPEPRRRHHAGTDRHAAARTVCPERCDGHGRQRDRQRHDRDRRALPAAGRTARTAPAASDRHRRHGRRVSDHRAGQCDHRSRPADRHPPAGHRQGKAGAPRRHVPGLGLHDGPAAAPARRGDGRARARRRRRPGRSDAGHPGLDAAVALLRGHAHRSAAAAYRDLLLCGCGDRADDHKAGQFVSRDQRARLLWKRRRQSHLAGPGAGAHPSRFAGGEQCRASGPRHNAGEPGASRTDARPRRSALLRPQSLYPADPGRPSRGFPGRHRQHHQIHGDEQTHRPWHISDRQLRSPNGRVCSRRVADQGQVRSDQQGRPLLRHGVRLHLFTRHQERLGYPSPISALYSGRNTIWTSITVRPVTSS